MGTIAATGTFDGIEARVGDAGWVSEDAGLASLLNRGWPVRGGEVGHPVLKAFWTAVRQLGMHVVHADPCPPYPPTPDESDATRGGAEGEGKAKSESGERCGQPSCPRCCPATASKGGFSGRITDRRGATRCYADGKPVRCESAGHSGGDRDAHHQRAADALGRLASNPAAASREDIHAAAEALRGLTVEEAKGLRRAMGLDAKGERGKGTKAALAAAISAEAARLIGEKGRWERQARAVGVEPEALHAQAGAIREVAAEVRTEAASCIREAKALWASMNGGRRLTRSHPAFRDGDMTLLPHWDDVAATMAGRYPGLLGATGYEGGGGADGASASQSLYDLLAAGAPPVPRMPQAWRQALDHLHAAGNAARDEVPF